MSIFVRIKQMSQEKGYSIAGVEKKLKLGNGTIRRWDINSPSVDKIANVANLLNVSVDFLLTGKESKREKSYSKQERRDILEGASKLSDEDFDVLAKIIKHLKSDNDATC